jgi:hypothetical protein
MVKRYYRCTLAEKWKEYLQGKANRVKWRKFDRDELLELWKTRWVIPRLDDLKENY